jgi:L-ribulose-5-phosphate 3-epimerase
VAAPAVAAAGGGDDVAAKLGIMQGRLLPPEAGRFQCFPRERWREEFPRAAQAGLDCIEWIVDVYGADVNPLLTETGIDEMRSLIAAHGVAVRSICADYFMEQPLVRVDAPQIEERLSFLANLMKRGAEVGVTRVVLPFVDASRLDTPEEISALVPILERALVDAETTGVEIHLETSLGPEPFARLLARLPHPMLKVNYDSGNSSSLGYHPVEEFGAYGDRVGSVHIKDRVLGGGTVPLGSGDADFKALFAQISRMSYRGDFILQVARGVPGEEVSLAQQNLAFVRGYLGAS